MSSTIRETERRLRKAIQVHLKGLLKDGLPIPEASSVVDYVDVLG
jgi:predicted RNase H-like HicB family nuclease